MELLKSKPTDDYLIETINKMAKKEDSLFVFFRNQQRFIHLYL